MPDKIAYRVRNGRLAVGVPKNFSAEELQKRRGRLALVRSQHPGSLEKARAVLSELREKAKADKLKIAAEVKAQAALGRFVPIQVGE